MKDNIFEITFKWEEKLNNNKSRIGVMYCFKNCDIHVN